MPTKLETGFMKADSQNLPVLHVGMVWEYLSESDCYSQPEVRGVKAVVSGRENYGDSAIGWVSVRRDGNFCILHGKICPEHHVKSKNYSIVLKIDEKNEKVISVQCLDCIAAQGGCKHGIAFLFWVNRRHESPSPTDMECYWRKPPLAAIGTNKKFNTAKQMAAKFSMGTKTKKDVQVNVKGFLKQVVAELSIKQLDCQLSRYTFALKARAVYHASIHQLLFNFTNEAAVDINFLEFAKEGLTLSLCKIIEQETKGQNNIPLWHEIRFGRITASHVYEASRCKTLDGSLVNKIIGISKIYDSVYMQRGRELEPEIINIMEKLLNCKIEKCGIFLTPSQPCLGASPDGIGPDFVLEIKCPSTEANIKRYINKNKINPKYKGQMNLQMFLTGKRKGLFCIADPNFEKNKNVIYQWINYDEIFTKSMIEHSIAFWQKSVFSRLVKTFYV